MNIVEKEAKKFHSDNYESGFYGGTKICNLDNLQSKLTNKLYTFSRDRDKLDFLKILRQESVAALEKHTKTCSKSNCDFVEQHETGIWVIDQKVDSINKYYHSESASEDTFTAEEESTLHCKLNEIAEQLQNLGYGQEIIFDEIESLKNHFNLGKKNWFQLLKGKLIDLTIEKMLDKTIIVSVFSTLSAGYNEFVKMIDK
jgi:hypothetical protein